VKTTRKNKKVSKQLALPNIQLSKLCWTALDPLLTKALFGNVKDSLCTGALADAESFLEPLHLCLNSGNDNLEDWRDAINKVVRKDGTLRCEQELDNCPCRTSGSIQSPEYLAYGFDIHDGINETEGCFPLQRYAGTAIRHIYSEEMLIRLLKRLSKAFTAMEKYSEPFPDPATRQDTRSSY
jgi:hypothetical protein